MLTRNSVTMGLTRESAAWLGMGVLLVIQWGLFRQFAQREILWGFPNSFDQVHYLGLSYETYENMLSQGIIGGLEHGVQLRAPQGTMIHLQAGVLFLLIGASRFSALTLNFIYFALFQCALAGTLRWLSGHWSVAWLGVGLLMSTKFRFFGGGLIDFRLDLITFCLYGVFICTVMRSDVFVSRRWSLVVGAVAALTVLFRFIAMVYMVGILGLVSIFLCIRLWHQHHNASARLVVKQQLHNLMLAGLVLLVVTAPILWYNRHAIERYYGVGHVTGPEPLIRARAVGVFERRDSLLFYPRSVYKHHAGLVFVLVSAVALAAAGGGALFRLWRGPNQIPLVSEQSSPDVRSPPPDILAGSFFIVTCLIVPLIALTTDVSKSPIVGSILVPPLIWMVVATVIILLGMHRARRVSHTTARIITALAVLSMGSGAYMEFHQATVRRIFSPIRADVEEVPKLFDRIGQYSQLMGWTSPRIAADRTYDFIYPGLLKPLAYERQGVLLHPQSVLSGSIFAVTEAEAITRLQQSDFAILTASSSVDERSSAYPFNVSMQEVTPALLEWANQHLVPLRRFQFFNRDVVLYIRPSLGIRGTSAEWITSDGMTLTGIAEVLRARPRIELIGRASFEYLGKVPGISAKLARPGQTPKPIHATIRASGPNAYHIVIELHPEDIQLETPVRMHLSFDTYYVPKNMGLYDDARRLVMQIPNEIVLLRQK